MTPSTSALSVSFDPDTSWEFQRDKIQLEYYKKQFKAIKDMFESSKIFLNMVVHDFRNPTSQIQFAIQFVLE